jgi:uncharacterized protein YndB with AHSA1/START domain
MKDKPVIVERTFDAPAEKVWRTITDKNEMKRWQFNIDDFKPEVGFEFRFQAGAEGRTYLHICKITDVVVGKKLAYSWRFDGYEGTSFVTFDLSTVGAKTKLKLTHTGLATFSPPNPDFARNNFAEGWSQILDTEIRKSLQS